MRTRILEGQNELQQLATIAGPFYERVDVIEQLGDAQVVAVEDDAGRIVAYWPIWVAVHLEPLWIDPASRRHPGVARALVEGMQAQLAVHGITTAFAVIAHDELVTNLPLAARIGFERVPGDLFFVRDTRQADTGARNGSSSDSGDLHGRAVLPQPGVEQAHAAKSEHRLSGPPELGD